MTPSPPRPRWPFALAGLAAGALLATAIVLAATERPPCPSAPAAAAATGRLEVVSVPSDGLVTLDGRLVGLTPIDGLDLAPGKHALVIEAFGYQPYAGTITIEAGGGASLEAHLAALGTDGASGGRWSGRGGHTPRPIPAAPAAPAAQPAADAAATAAATARKKPRPREEPPARDCDGELSSCKDSCDRTAFSCRASCQYCGSCVTSMTWDECNRICDTCRQGCEQNESFCRSSCQNQRDNCR